MRALPILLIALLTGCSMTLPVVGQFKNDRAMFRGEATGQMDGTGTLTVRAENGANCTGRFKYGASRVTGEGTISCIDGRTGDFYFTSSGMDGEGFGKLSDGEQFRFQFGDPAKTAAMAEGLKQMGEGLKAMNQPPPVIVTQPPAIISVPETRRTHCTTNLSKTGIDCTTW